MQKIKSNEDEFKSQAISWLNEFLKQGSYPFEVASAEPSVKVQAKKTKFPDVQIWLNRKAQQGFCGWELKTPKTPVDDQELLENAAEKARAMHADYFVTWNMRDAVIWRTPQWTETVTRVHRLKTYSSMHQIDSPEDLWVGFKQELLKSKAKEILNDLSTLHKEGHLHLIDVDSVFFVHRLSESVKALWPHFHKSLLSEVGKNSKFKNGLFDWAVKQGIATYEAGEIFYETVSRQVVYRLIGKILFYLTLRRFRTDIPKLDLHGLNPAKITERLKEYFETARQIDYQAVFEEDFTDSVPFPPTGTEALISLLDDLNRYNFSYMPQDVIGSVFEKLIPPEERHALGQYFTREDLADLITAFCVRSKTDKVLDPTCGTGTFLLRAYDRIRNSGEKKHSKLLSQLWGIDIAHFPAELATINLYRQNIEDYANFPRVLAKDFFEVRTGDKFKFPPPKPSTGSDFMIEEEVPVFDGIVGNFPYIRQELIEKRFPDYKDTLSNILKQDWKADYGELFNNGDLKLSGQADIYAYLFFHAAKHLKEEGRMGIITSNSWLDVAYGYELQKFFLKKFKIIAIFESRCEPWFEDAAVNTVVTVLERCSEKEKRDEHNVKFVKIKKRLKELIPWDIKLPMQRWFGLDKLVYRIENAGSELYMLKEDRYVNSLKDHRTYEDDNFRIRVVRQGELLEQVEESGKTVKWGQYLRAPEVYFEILNKSKACLIPLKQVSEIKFGLKTGINEFFYPSRDKIEHWGIESEFLFPIFKSPKESDSIAINSEDLEVRAFICKKTKTELRKEKKFGALKYIEWGEKQKTNGGIAWPDVPSVQGRTPGWWVLPDLPLTQIFWSKAYDIKHLHRYSKIPLLCDCRIYFLKPKGKNISELLAASLNSTLAAIFLELIGRVNLGEGALDVMVEDAEEYMLIPNIFGKNDKKILNAFNHLLSRHIKPIFEEIKMKDRQALDSAVLEALGLDPKKYLKPLYEGITELVRERIELAKSRKKIKQAKTKKDIDQLKKQIIEEITPDGVKKFPEEFIDSKYLKDSNELSVPADPLKLGSYFIGQQEVISESGFKYDAEGLDEAKFIIYSKKPDSFTVKVPKKKPALIKAIDDYERYLRELKDKFFEAFFNRVLDHKQADSLVQQVFTELNLPEL
jgi:type I restriction enzyme M protein